MLSATQAGQTLRKRPCSTIHCRRMRCPTGADSSDHALRCPMPCAQKFPLHPNGNGRYENRVITCIATRIWASAGNNHTYRSFQDQRLRPGWVTRILNEHHPYSKNKGETQITYLDGQRDANNPNTSASPSTVVQSTHTVL